MRDVVTAWYVRTPRAATSQAFDMALELFGHDERELALDDLSIRLRMQGIRLTREEHAFLVGIVRSFPGPVDSELLDELDEFLDLRSDERGPT